jgi:hypothetical protein
VLKQFEGDPPLLTIAVKRSGLLVDAHDQADAALEVPVGEGYTVADAEVSAAGDLRWRT